VQQIEVELFSLFYCSACSLFYSLAAGPKLQVQIIPAGPPEHSYKRTYGHDKEPGCEGDEASPRLGKRTYACPVSQE
jgi:hypothetical protein